jgi:anti-anti-sigma factor
MRISDVTEQVNWPAAPANPFARAVGACATVPLLEVTVREMSDEVVVQVKGEAMVTSARALLDAARRSAVVTLDLSQLRCISSLAMGVLVTFRRGVVRRGGRVRLAEGLQPAVQEALMRAQLLDLFETTDSAATVIADV